MTSRATLIAPATARQEIKKSRFVANAGPAADEAAAKAFIAANADAGAGHNCWAWRIGQTYRFSDDGEPGGTAGKPILQAIDGQGLDQVAVVVTRWFGGILLGSGGLIRAYGGTAALCLREAATTPLVAMASGTIDCAFSDLAGVQARLAGLGVQTLDTAYTGAGAVLSISAPAHDIEALGRIISDLTSGRTQVKWSG